MAPFQSIEVSGGAHVVVRRAPTHRVRLVAGSTEMSRAEVSSTGVLTIDKCRSKCPKGYKAEFEVFAPALKAISVAHGGRVETRDAFSGQAELTVEVSNGGTIDVRNLPADRVTASVNQGGGILTTPRRWLSATVAQGGNVTYWGDPEVKSAVDKAGAVQKGRD